MSITLSGVNVWAVLVSAVASFMVGGLWYGVLFLKSWVTLHGITEEQGQALAKKQGRNFALFFVGDLVMATVISVLMVNLEIATAVQGALLGLVLWLGVAATLGGAKKAAEGKPLALYAIDTSHELTSLVVMGVILGAWR